MTLIFCHKSFIIKIIGSTNQSTIRQKNHLYKHRNTEIFNFKPDMKDVSAEWLTVNPVLGNLLLVQCKVYDILKKPPLPPFSQYVKNKKKATTPSSPSAEEHVSYFSVQKKWMKV